MLADHFDDAKVIGDTERALLVMISFLRGHEIEFRPVWGEHWSECFTPRWEWGRFVYRVKGVQPNRRELPPVVDKSLD
jgi:hypothetical protein